LIRVNVFRPIEKLDLPFVLYPMRAYHLRLKFRRLGMADKVMDYFAYVDCVRAGIERGNSILPVEEWTVDEKLIMKENVDEEEALKIAIEGAKKWGNSMVVSWWNPKVDVIEKVKAYKVFWIDKKIIIDSLTCERFRV